MELHKNARSCPASRLLLVRRVGWGMSVTRAAEAAGISKRTAFKWKRRYLEAGEAALLDRTCRPHRMPRQAHPDRVEEVLRLRRRRLTGPQIAARVGLSTATVARILARSGLARLKSLEPKPPVVRYQRDRPGELIHVDIKKLGRIGRVGHRIHGDRTTQVRGIGWEFVHVAIDDASRLAYAEVLPNERSPSSTGFLRRSVAWFQNRGVQVQAVMSDNGSCYRPSSMLAADGSNSVTCAPGPTALKPMARPNASSRPCCASGPTKNPTQPQRKEPTASPNTSTATISGDPMPHSTNAPRLNASVNNLLRTDT